MDGSDDHLIAESNPDSEAPWLSEVARELPGWPGYRTRPGRSGFDPLDNEFELAHMQGLFLRRLLTGRLRTKEPAYLTAMVIIGLAAVAPTTVALLAMNSPGEAGLVLACLMSPLALFGTSLLINATLSLQGRPPRPDRSA